MCAHHKTSTRHAIWFKDSQTRSVNVQRLKSKTNEHTTGLMKHLPKESLSCRQGRPRGERPSLAEFATCWYLIWISKKYGFETRKFFTGFLDAWMRGKSSCKNVSIECRQKTETDGVFLVTQDQDVVAQVRMSEMALNRLSNVDLASFPWSEITFVEKVEKYGKM